MDLIRIQPLPPTQIVFPSILVGNVIPIKLVMADTISDSASAPAYGETMSSAPEETSDDSSSASSPLPVDNLGPLFQVQFFRVTLDPSILTFRVCRLDDPEGRDKWWEISRSYEDFTSLNAALNAAPKHDGIIFPPLPQMLAVKHEDVLDAFPLTYLHKQLERYLQLICIHTTLGRSQIVSNFLSTSYAPPQDRSGRWGIFAKLAKGLETKKVPARDIEDFFENERQWSNNYLTNLKLVLGHVSTVSQCQNKLTGQLKHLSTALSMNPPTSESSFEMINHRFQSNMAQSILKVQDVMAATQGTCAESKGLLAWHCVWDLYSQYIANEQQMLNRRTALLVNYENANRNWDKAKTAKKDEAEASKKTAEQAFEECSDAARHEIKAFHKQRVSEMRSSLTQLARHELDQARRLKALLGQTLEQTRQFHIPCLDQSPSASQSAYPSI